MLPDLHGIDLAALVADPTPLDVVSWLHGVAAYRYAKKGPMITEQRWRQFNRLAGGYAGGFALFFN